MGRADVVKQQDKYVAFKTAYQTIAHYQDQGNFIGAYVVAFSLIEDRVRAMFVVQYRSANDGASPSPQRIAESFAKHVRQLQVASVIPQEKATQLLEEAKRRNELLHAAMCNLKAFDEAAVDRGIKLARIVDKLRYAQKKERDQ